MIKLLSLDSTGTLLHIAPSVSHHYLTSVQLIKPCYKDLDPNFEHHFIKSYTAQNKASPNFGCGKEGSYCWWSEVVAQTFTLAGISLSCKEFELVFDDVYNKFGTQECWAVFPEVTSVLEKVKQRGIKCVVVSDFDRRLPSILKEFGLFDKDGLISEVYQSYDEGMTKPGLLSRVLDIEGVSGAECVHVGDSWRRDVEGARRAGIRPVYVARKGSCEERDGVKCVRSLKGVLDCL